MDAFVKRCEHCGKPVPEMKRGRPQRFCSDAHRQAHRGVLAVREREPGDHLTIPGADDGDHVACTPARSYSARVAARTPPQSCAGGVASR